MATPAADHNSLQKMLMLSVTLEETWKQSIENHLPVHTVTMLLIKG